MVLTLSGCATGGDATVADDQDASAASDVDASLADAASRDARARDVGTDAADAQAFGFDASPADAATMLDSAPAGCQGNTDCPMGNVCNKTSHVCVGCLANTDCAAPKPKCDTAASACVACIGDGDCPLGNLCKQNVCAQGCSATQACPSGQVCNTPAGVCVQCLTDASCSGATPRCNTASNTCVQCLPSNDNCPTGQYCGATTCVPGCRGDADCAPTPSTSVCDVPSHACVQCLDDSKCPLGQVCTGKACVGGCDATHGCPAGQGCCGGGMCSPLDTPTSCTGCNLACDTAHSQGRSCNGTTCTYAGCAAGFGDCNTTAPDLDGCETATSTPSSCGGCGRACSTNGVAGASCSGVACNSSCVAGFGNCSQPAYPAPDDGCESNLTTCAGSPCCGTLCTAQHQVGLNGNTYSDCHAFGVPGNAATYTHAMADEATNAWTLGGTVVTGTGTCADPQGGAALYCTANYTSARCGVWCAEGVLAGYVLLTTQSGSGGSNCLCPVGGGATWN